MKESSVGCRQGGRAEPLVLPTAERSLLPQQGMVVSLEKAGFKEITPGATASVKSVAFIPKALTSELGGGLGTRLRERGWVTEEALSVFLVHFQFL